MTDQYGADQAAWHHFTTLGLTADLLPVVSDPTVPISPDSTMKAMGKTPSVINFRGHAAGFPKWTKYEATERDIAKWSLEPRYGICIQTRHLRCIDIDVPDPVKARAIIAEIEQVLPGAWFAERYRDGTGKTLLVFLYEGVWPKRTIEVAGGIVEFLGDGQQFIAEGMHPDGTRYKWRDLPATRSGLQVLEEHELLAVWDALVLKATGAVNISRVARAPGEIKAKSVVGDKLEQWLLGGNWEIHDEGSAGEIYLRCPFDEEHTSDTGYTSTTYFPAGTGGYEQGHWKCLHAHCMGRTDEEFNSGVGYCAAPAEDFPDLSGDRVLDGRGLARVDGERGVGDDGVPDEGKPLAGLFAGLPKDKNGKIESSYDFLCRAVGRPGLMMRHIAFDAFEFAIMWAPLDDPTAWRRWEDRDYVSVRLQLERAGFKPFANTILRAIVEYVAKERTIDTAKVWLATCKWDGVPRIDRFFPDRLGTVDTPYTRALGRYLFTGLAGRILEPGVQLDIVPILVGPQGTRKTSAVQALCPHTEAFTEIDLMHRDDDTSRKLRGTLVAELGELRGMLGRAAESTKAFITQRFEEWTPKYMEMQTRFWRRCMFIGTTNQHEFLADATGERRYAPIETLTEGAIDTDWIIANRDQLWAEGALLFTVGGVDYADVEQLAKPEHERFKMVDGWASATAAWLVQGDEMKGAPVDRPYEWGTEDALVEAIGMKVKDITRAHQMRMGALLLHLGCTKKRVRDAGWRYAGRNVPTSFQPVPT